MDVSRLPVEILLEILHWSVWSRSLKRILRLRLVNKLFASEVPKYLLAHSVLYDHISPRSQTGLPPLLSAARLVYYMNTDPTEERHERLFGTDHDISGKRIKSRQYLLVIKDVAVALAKADTRSGSADEVLSRLCSLAVSKCRYGNIWKLSECITPGCSFDACEYNPPPVFGRELFAAALCMQVSPLNLDTLPPLDIRPDVYSHFFGNGYEYAVACNESRQLVTSLFTLSAHASHPRYVGITRRALLRAAAERGDLAMVRFIWDYESDTRPWVFAQSSLQDYEGHRNNRLLARMHTPSIKVFEYLMEKRHVSCVGKTWGPLQWTYFLIRCAKEGWTEMAAHFIELGAHIDGYTQEEMTRDPQGTRYSVPLDIAARNDRRDVVRLLLAHGAKASTLTLSTAVSGGCGIVEMLLQHREIQISQWTIRDAARRGCRATVKALLGRCPDAKSIAQEYLVYAVQFEDEELFGFLVKVGGGGVAEHVREKCIEACRTDGLESMEKLVVKAGITP